MAGAGDHPCPSVEIGLPTARQGRSVFNLFKTYLIRGVGVAILQIKVASIPLYRAFELDVQAVGEALDNHVFQFGT